MLNTIEFGNLLKLIVKYITITFLIKTIIIIALNLIKIIAVIAILIIICWNQKIN